MSLFSKLTIGGQELKNRIVLSPLTRARCTTTEDPFDEINTIPNDLMVEYYGQRAAGGCALLITEATAISEQGSGWLNAPHIRTAAQVEGWKRVTDRVHAEGGLIYLQMWHMGRTTHSSFHPTTDTISAPSAIPIGGDGLAKTTTRDNVSFEVPTPMTIEEIQQAIAEFATAALLAQQAGFDGVEIQASGGYLIDTFLQSATNQRTDDYGGSMENRMRLLEQVIEAIVAAGAYPENRVGVRIAPNCPYNDMGSADNDTMFPFVAQALNKYGLAYLHAMDGFGFHEKCAAVSLFDLKKHFSAPIICNGGLTKDLAEGMLRSGAADLCAFGRLFITNPDLPLRFGKDWPLAESPPYEAWWQPTGAVGYTDWPMYKSEK